MPRDGFSELLIILTFSLLAVMSLRRWRVPPTLAYLAAGMLVGPTGLGLITDAEAVAGLAEFGIVFLLFSLGLEFALPQLIAMRHSVFGLGAGQVGLCLGILLGLGLLLQLPPTQAFIYAGALSLSSTAIVSKELTLRNELHTRFGRLAIAILLFQDLASVMLLLLIPALAAGQAPLAGLIGLMLLKAALLLLLMLWIGKYVLPRLFMAAARARSEELFVLTALVVVLLAATLASLAGLSMALGAFLAGMTLGESHYRHQLEAEIRPFRDVLLGIFFVTIGMMLDLRLLLAQWHWLLLIAVTVMLLKTGVITVLGILFRESPQDSLRTGLTLAQGGEFGFALLALAAGQAVVDRQTHSLVLASIILSMMLAPALIRYRENLLTRLFKPSAPPWPDVTATLHNSPVPLQDHVILCGFGRVGQVIGRFLRQEGIPYVALDADPVRVQAAALAGENIHYGDGTQASVLHALGLSQARLLVIAFNDDRQAFTVLRLVRRLREDLPVLVRTADDSQWKSLREAGATEVVPEVMEGSLMLVSHVLSLLQLPPARIQQRVQEVRRRRYELLHGYFHGERSRVLDEEGRPLEMIQAVVLPAGAHAVGLRLAELEFGQMEAQVQAVRRAGQIYQDPPPPWRLAAEDVVILRGTAEQVERAERYLLSGAGRAEHPD
jgi:CPA2 family monovalent cation:H+ antiporter-2